MNRRQFVKLTPAFPAAAVTASLTLREDGKEPIADFDVSVLRLQPGDVVVLSTVNPITADTGARIKALVEDVFDGRVKAMVLGSDVHIEGVLR